MIDISSSKNQDISLTKSSANGKLGGFIVLKPDEAEEVLEYLAKFFNEDDELEGEKPLFLRHEFLCGAFFGVVLSICMIIYSLK